MITGVRLPSISAGERGDVVIFGADPIEVEIRCFVHHPPPPEYRPCSECGVLRVFSGQPFSITANDILFGPTGGELVLEVSDADGDQKQYVLQVASLTSSSSQPLNYCS